ncbi:MAG: BlaI/MecI/CopY family transcriptional regulator [Planctomycetota bacterium]|nr:BlaI/MecI/CopY family transcriptional regulator [Planctomycetota bacterium]
MDKQGRLSGRERQIMDIVYGLGEASATQVLQAMPDAPTRTSVRTFLRILEEKGHLKHRKEGREFIFAPTRPRERVGQSALQKVLSTFFAGSIEQAVAAHLADRGTKVSPDELKRLESLIRQARAKEKLS